MRIDEFVQGQTRLSASTLEGYASDLQTFESRTKSTEPTLKTVQQYIGDLRQRGTSGAYISRVLYALKRYCSWAGTAGEVFGPGKVEVPALEFKEHTTAITEEDVLKLMRAASTPLERILVGLLFSTGMRIGELLRIRAEDIDWETGEVSIRRKGRRERRETLALDPATLRLLKEYQERVRVTRGQLFFQTYQDLRKWFRHLAYRAGVTFPRGSLFHQLRHAFVITQRLDGRSLEDISQAIGHTSLTTTLLVYGRLSPQDLRARLKPPPWAEQAES